VDRVLYEACPVCTSKQFEELRKGYVQEHPMWRKGMETFIQWMKCGTCGHVFTNGYLTEEVLAKVVQRTPETQVPGWEPSKARGRASRTVELAQLLSETAGRRWLDVGCGDGSILGFAQECGYSVRGIDIRVDTVNLLRAAGLEVDLIDFMALPDGKPYDVISMRDVIEHLPHPQRAIERARAHTAKRGLLIISTPSREALVWKLPGPLAENPYWGELEHYHMFSAAGLRELLENTGFAQEAARTSEKYRGSIEIYARRI